MVNYEELKTKYPAVDIVLKGLWILFLATVVSFLLVLPIYLFNPDRQLLVDIFTFPVDIIPPPYNLIGLIPIPLGMGLIVWANYNLLQVGKIGLAAREPMQTPSTLVVSGPYRYSRNPLYFGGLMMLLGLVIVWSSLIVLLGLFGVYIIIRYKFIHVEEQKLEEAFGDEYLEYKKRVGRWY
ncbi:MAG: methyltransferase family protein [Candidatus Thorarchaeota archaeon]|jgi:protein-S-isoprenylcysteine O-methyltransferase Ste14